MEMVEIHPAVFVWALLLANWIGNCSACTNVEESKTYIKIMGIALLLTGILMLGIWIGNRP